MSLLQGIDPFTQASFTLKNRIKRAAWYSVQASLFRYSPRSFHGWRALLLRFFGAKLGGGCHIYPGVKIWAPWNLVLGNKVGIGDGVLLYCMDRIVIGNCAVISQGAHLCCGTHDFNSANFQLIVKPIIIGARAWICADVFIHPGVVVSEGAVVGARAVVVKNLSESWAVYAGNPAVKVSKRMNNFA